MNSNEILDDLQHDLERVNEAKKAISEAFKAAYNMQIDDYLTYQYESIECIINDIFEDFFDTKELQENIETLEKIDSEQNRRELRADYHKSVL